VLPVAEGAPLKPQSVYGRTKRIIEDFLRDLARANPNWRIAVLRYFNPAGAHESGRIGEAPHGRPNNLVPLLCRIAAGEFAELAIYGSDWPTPDGTGVRDYIHVQDLADGHVAALAHLARAQGAFTLNLGLGRGYSVLEVVAAFERACGRKITKVVRAAPARRRCMLVRGSPRARPRRSIGIRRATWTRSAPTRGGGRRTAAGIESGDAPRPRQVAHSVR
jgi:UDP-glucose 4-epimerase